MKETPGGSDKSHTSFTQPPACTPLTHTHTYHQETVLRASTPTPTHLGEGHTTAVHNVN